MIAGETDIAPSGYHHIMSKRGRAKLRRTIVILVFAGVPMLLGILVLTLGPVSPFRHELSLEEDVPVDQTEPVATPLPNQRLSAIIEAHKQWIESDGKSGRRANLSYANLQGANLHEAKLAKANLSHAFLAEADLSGADLSEADMSHIRAPIHDDQAGEYDRAFNLSGARLVGADLTGAELIAIDATHADFTNAKLVDAQLNSSDFTGANFDHADLTGVSAGPYVSPNTGDDWIGVAFDGASFEGSRLSNAFLAGASFRSASLELTDMDGARLYSTSFEGATFEPTKLPPVREVAVANGLASITFERSPSAFFQLAEELKKSGLRRQEREVTYALRRTRAIALGQRCYGYPTDIPACASYVGQTIVFDLPVAYGLHPLRPLLIAGALIPLFGLLYYALLATSTRTALAIVLKAFAFDRRRVLQSSVVLSRKHGFARELARIRLSVLLSLMSSVNVGFREIDFGRWVRMVMTRDFELRPRGWLRVASGAQTLLTLYLLALSILSYFGSPFLQ